jgi:8-oxo-dGTP pyrophosphatase MutT (NUDIX family)
MLRRRPGRSLPGVWQPVTGKLERGETAVEAALREVREETGVRARRLWRLEQVAATLDPKRDVIKVISRFACELGATARVRVSAEHTAHRFVSAREAARHFLWDSQREGLAAVRSQVLRGGPRARALEIAVPDSTR